MKTFNGDKNLKTMLLEEIGKHRKADQIVQGYYGKENGKWTGCAVGCSIHSLNLRLNKTYKVSDHSVYEKELGIPIAIARLEDRIFEGLPKEKAVLWPERFIQAVNVNADLSLAVPKLMFWLMGDIKQFVKKEYPEVLKAIETVEELAAYDDADAAAAAYAAAAYADAAAAAYADDAYAAAYAYADAADAYAAYAYADAYAAAARQNYWIKISDKLIQLLKESK